MATRSFIDFRKFFTKRPQWVAFPLTTERKLAQGVCWFGDSDVLPSSRKALHEYLGASEEEIETMKTQGLGGKTLKEANPALKRNSTISSQESHSANALELQTGIDLATQDILYACSSQSQGMLAVGRSKNERLPRTLASIQYLVWALPLFTTAPNLMGSGKELAGWNSPEGIKAHLTPVPWQFAVINADNTEKISRKLNTFMTLIGCPDRLWALCMQKDEFSHRGIFRLSACPIVRAGGNRLPVPEKAFGLTREYPEYTGDGFTFAVYLFWQDAADI